MKKHRIAEEQGESDEAEQDGFERITLAYNLLMGYEEPVAEAPAAPNPLLKKLGIDEKKAGNFFYYYKFHIIIGILLVVLIFFTVRSFVTRVEPDFTTAFIGEINYSQTDKLIAQIRESVPEIKEPGVDGAFITASGNGQNDYAMTMKAIAVFTSGGADLYVMDKNEFDKFVKDNALISLDDIAAKLGVDPAKSPDLVTSTEDSPEKHLYGIDITKSAALSKAEVYGTRMIAVIPGNTKKQDTAIKLIEYLLKQ